MARLLEHKLGKEICEALDIDPSDIYHIKLEIGVDSISTIELGQYLKDGQEKIIGKVLKNYKLEATDEQGKRQG